MNENENPTPAPDEAQTNPSPEAPATPPEESPGTDETTAEPAAAQEGEQEISDENGDFARQAENDLAELKAIDPAASLYRHIGEMPGALRFAELRELGLSVEEAYYAVRGSAGEKPLPDRGGRAHLHGSVPGRAASGGVGMTVGEIEAARRLFPNLPDREIASLFRRVNETRNQ